MSWQPNFKKKYSQIVQKCVKELKSLNVMKYTKPLAPIVIHYDASEKALGAIWAKWAGAKWVKEGCKLCFPHPSPCWKGVQFKSDKLEFPALKLVITESLDIIYIIPKNWLLFQIIIQSPIPWTPPNQTPWTPPNQTPWTPPNQTPIIKHQCHVLSS